MCKVFMVAGIKPDKVPMVAKLAKHMAKAMSSVEDDGVGYAAITSDCKVYGEKWLNKDDAFNVHESAPPDPIAERIAGMFGDTIEMEKKPVIGTTYASFGDRNGKTIGETVAMILHARKATQGSKTIVNVHPFVKFGEDAAAEPYATALIHNGSILNHDKLTKEMSECDSEVILHEYLSNMMYHNPWGIDNLAKTLVGQYTVGVLSSQLVDNVWTPYLDIFKSNKELIGGWVPELETFVYCTMKYTLEEGLKAAGMTLVNDFKFKDGHLHRIDALTGIATEKPVSFSTSAQHMSGFNKSHENSAGGTRRSDTRATRDVFPYGPLRGDDITETGDDTVESAKKHFERRHPALFTEPYLEADITVEEKAFFDFLDKDQKTDRKALRLVDAALGRGA